MGRGTEPLARTMVATANRCDISAFTGTIGLPIPSTEVAILDDDGKELPIGSVGEIAIRGPQVMAGYWNRPDETAKVMTPDGYFKSGDVGIMDEKGYVKIVDAVMAASRGEVGHVDDVPTPDEGEPGVAIKGSPA